MRRELTLKSSNYETMKQAMAQKFSRYDTGAMIEKFQLQHDAAYLYLPVLGRAYRIDRRSGQVSWSDDGFLTSTEADYNAAMTLYDVLCCSEPDCHLAHTWVNVRSLARVQGGTLEKSGDFFQGAGRIFSGKADALARRCQALLGKKLDQGDVAYQLDLLPFLPLQLVFWEADEDFPASLQFFVDRNTLAYMHYETLMFALSHVLDRLQAQA